MDSFLKGKTPVMEFHCLKEDLSAYSEFYLHKKASKHLKSHLNRQNSSHQSRIISKNGRHVRTAVCSAPQKKELYLLDWFTTLMDAQWGWVFLIFSSAFLSSWLFFGTAWWLIVWLRQKFDSERICVENVNSWTTAFLFSVETQTTIGYGGRQVH